MGLAAKWSQIKHCWGSLLFLMICISCHPVVAQGGDAGEKIMGNGAAKVDGASGGLISAVFVGINYLTGIAAIGALIFGLISLWQRLKSNEAVELAEQATDIEGAPAAESASAESADAQVKAAEPPEEKSQEKSEAKADEVAETPEAPEAKDQSKEANDSTEDKKGD
jgi:hypothetical protein